MRFSPGPAILPTHLVPVARLERSAGVLKGDDDLLPLNGWKGERQIIVGQWQGGAPRSGPRVGIQAKSWLQQPNASQIKSLRYLRPSKSDASGNTAV
jgi:hypothetical protein